jgi:hypothetical protein
MGDSDKVGNDNVGNDKVGNDKVGNDKVGQLQEMLLALTARVASLETQVNASRGPITLTTKNEDMPKGEANISTNGGKRRRSRRRSRRGKRPRKSRRSRRH